MKIRVYQFIAGVLLVSTMSCQKAPEHTQKIFSRHDIWEQDPIEEIYEDNKPVPTLPIFNCRLDSSETSQRYFRLKINKNNVEKYTSEEGAEITIYRRAMFRHFVKNMQEANVTYFDDYVTAVVDVTVIKTSGSQVLMSVVLSLNRPFAFDHNLFAPEGSDVENVQAGERLVRVMMDTTVKNSFSVATKFQIMGGENTKEQPAECEYINL